MEKEILGSITYVSLPDESKTTYKDGVSACKSLTVIQGWQAPLGWSGPDASGVWTSLVPTILGDKGVRHPMSPHVKRYDAVGICSNEQLHVAFMAGYDAEKNHDALGKKIPGPGWVEDVYPEGSGKP